jgi:hypothetical protein
LNETWLNPELIQKYPLGSEEREKLIRVLIATLERIKDIEDREGVEKIHYLKTYN